MITRKLNIREIIEKNRSFFLLGPRGTGKTNLVNASLSNNFNVMTVDLLKISEYRRYLQNPTQLRDEVTTWFDRHSQETLHVFIDEVQKIPELLDEVHALIETFKPRLSFILTGSSTRKLKRSGANLLAGRAWMRHLHPLSSEEVNLDLMHSLQFGTLPVAYLEDDPEEFLKSYLDVYLKEEIFQESLVRRIENFSRFIDIAGQLNGEPINFTKLARQCSVSVKTAQEYFQILEDTLVVSRVPGWSSSVKKQLMQAPKFYFFDCGVLNTINGELRSELKTSTYRYGRLFENLVIQEILRANDYRGTPYKPYYWRTHQGSEIDLLLAKNTRKPQWAIEIKSQETPQLDELRAFASIKNEFPEIQCVCLCQTPRPYVKDEVTFLPWKEGVLRLIDE